MPTHMSSLLDFGPIYNQTGSISQIEYATKCADNGSTIIAIKSNKGLVIAIEKPKESCLIKNKENKRLVHLSNKIYSCFSGLLTDGQFISAGIKRQIINFVKLNEEISAKAVKGFISEYVSIFTRYFNTRPVGCNFITGMMNDGNYHILLTDCTSKTHFYKACAIGKGSVRARTELEKNNYDDMEVIDLAENAVRIMYRCHDPIKDKEFDIELCYMNESTGYKMVEANETELNVLIEKYKHLSVD
ncbi:hypothetical protein H311_01285 [Anncaliia algerae PRA109]|nr:hypothetical protein H311_01285 [Anncaliia algerae PRA109]